MRTSRPTNKIRRPIEAAYKGAQEARHLYACRNCGAPLPSLFIRERPDVAVFELDGWHSEAGMWKKGDRRHRRRRGGGKPVSTSPDFEGAWWIPGLKRVELPALFVCSRCQTPNRVHVE